MNKTLRILKTAIEGFESPETAITKLDAVELDVTPLIAAKEVLFEKFMENLKIKNI